MTMDGGIRQRLEHSTVSLSYLQWGQGNAPVLLLHGLADHGLVWSALGTELAAWAQVVAVDMRGHGDSDKPDTGYDAATIIGDLQHLIEHLGWTSAHVVGHSWGAKIAAIWATRYPQQVRSLILVDPIFIYGLPGIFRLTFPLFYQVLPFLQGMGPFDSFQQAVEKAKTLKQYRAWTPLQQQVFTQGLGQTADGKWRSKFTPAARDGIFTDVLKTPGLVQPLTVPTLFIQPAAGVNRFNWQLWPYRRYLKNLTIQPVPGNHWAFLVEPAAFNAAVSAFLQAQPDVCP